MTDAEQSTQNTGTSVATQQNQPTETHTPPQSQQTQQTQQNPSSSNSPNIQAMINALDALPEKLANILAERNPKPTQQQPPTKEETKQEIKQETKQETPGKKTFVEWWFGGARGGGAKK